MVTVREVIGSFILYVKKLFLKEVNKSGAVSPATFAAASRTPVNMPAAAPRQTICVITLL